MLKEETEAVLNEWGQPVLILILMEHAQRDTVGHGRPSSNRLS